MPTTPGDIPFYKDPNDMVMEDNNTKQVSREDVLDELVKPQSRVSSRKSQRKNMIIEEDDQEFFTAQKRQPKSKLSSILEKMRKNDSNQDEYDKVGDGI